MLHAQELPSEGGDTLFADMHKAWDQLPEHLRKAVDGRTPRTPTPRVTAKPNSKATGARR
jgi:alpha-ketoglutarate-dependent taurine dioxygenase